MRPDSGTTTFAPQDGLNELHHVYYTVVVTGVGHVVVAVVVVQRKVDAVVERGERLAKSVAEAVPPLGTIERIGAAARVEVIRRTVGKPDPAERPPVHREQAVGDFLVQRAHSVRPARQGGVAVEDRVVTNRCGERRDGSVVEREENRRQAQRADDGSGLGGCATPHRRIQRVEQGLGLEPAPVSEDACSLLLPHTIPRKVQADAVLGDEALHSHDLRRCRDRPSKQQRSAGHDPGECETTPTIPGSIHTPPTLSSARGAYTVPRRVDPLCAP